jgi:hypothetical protein
MPSRRILGRCLVEAASQVQHAGDRQVLVQRHVLRDERDAVQRGRAAGTGPTAAVARLVVTAVPFC